MTKIFLITIVLLSLYLFPPPVNAQVPTTGWPMVAANPARTGWTPDEVAPNAHVEWYRSIDAYIPPNFQAIVANDLVYISSARGLYAMRYDTGDDVWRFDSDMPLGNAPTIASVTIAGTSKSVAFVGSYDKKVHAFDALTGVPIWESPQAPAGFDANPLVISDSYTNNLPLVFIGNRDGYFYAYDATNGQLRWQYPSAGQPGIGAIHLSPAYKDGVIYFATDYNYGYALNANGTLKWKSPRLVSDGFNSYWPVIYTNSSTNKDYVIFTGKPNYRESMRPGTRSHNDLEWYPYGIDLASPFSRVDNYTLNYLPTAEYLYTNRKQSLFSLLDASTGQYYTFDSDRDGQLEYLPVWQVQNPGTQTPPVVRRNDPLIYFDNYYDLEIGNRNYVMGWQFGTSLFKYTNVHHAGDEPEVLSGGGNYLFRMLCCNRIGDYAFFDNLKSGGDLWSYDISSQAPQFDEKLFYFTEGNPDINLGAVFGTKNGIYGYHGDQNQITSYNGKAYAIRGNSIIAFGNGTPQNQLQLLASAAPPAPILVPSQTELVARLEKEIAKFDANGDGTLDILKPGYYEDSQFGNSYYLLDQYFDNPGDTLYTLSLAYPFVTNTPANNNLKNRLKTYLTNTIYTGYLQNGVYRIGWHRGFQRDSVEYPPEVASDMLTLTDNYDWYWDTSLVWTTSHNHLGPIYLYGLYLYAKNVAPENIAAIYQFAADSIGTPVTSLNTNKPYEINAYLSGYAGFLKLQELAGQTVQDTALRTAVTNALNSLKTQRINSFSKDEVDGYGQNMHSISRNFIWLVPESAEYLRTSRLAAVQTALNEYNTVAPYWFVSRFNAGAAESGSQNLYDYPSNFQARAWILQSPREELYKFLDTPAFERGDLFYIQNLVATIEAPYSGISPTPGQATATPTRTPLPGDINGDRVVNILDYTLLSNNFGTNNTQSDLNNDSLVNILDYTILSNNFGRAG